VSDKTRSPHSLFNRSQQGEHGAEQPAKEMRLMFSEKKEFIILLLTINKNNQKGFILVTVLFFFFIMSLMTLSILHHSCLELRMSRNFLMTSQQFQAAEAGLKKAEHWAETLQTPALFLQKSFTEEGFQMDTTLRRHTLPYCIHPYSAYVYDIIVKTSKDGSNALRLQSTYVIKTNHLCQSRERQLTRTGRYSWRELNALSSHKK